MKQVCSARSDIKKQVDKLTSMTPATFSAGAVQDAVTAIGADVGKIKDAQPKLNEKRKQEIQSANQTFSSSVQSITGQALKSLSAGNAAAQLEAAAKQLGDAYKQSLAKVDCG